MLLLQEMLQKEEYEKAEGYFKDLTAVTPRSVYQIATVEYQIETTGQEYAIKIMFPMNAENQRR